MHNLDVYSIYSFRYNMVYTCQDQSRHLPIVFLLFVFISKLASASDVI